LTRTFSFGRIMTMKKTALLLSILISASFLSPARAADSGAGVPQEVIDLGLKFLDDPGDFFFNLHSDNEDFSPVPTKRRGAIRFNFFPTFFPLTWGSLNLKVKLLNADGNIPQVDISGMYGDMLALRAIPSSDDGNSVKPVFNDYSVGLIISRAATEKTKIFGGGKYSAISMNVQLSTPVVMGAFQMSSLGFQVADTFFFTGISHEVGKDSFVVAQAAYGFKYKKIVSRIMMSHKHLELGMDIFPEGLFVFHPFLAWHWYF